MIPGKVTAQPTYFERLCRLTDLFGANVEICNYDGNLVVRVTHDGWPLCAASAATSIEEAAAVLISEFADAVMQEFGQ